MRNVRHQYEGSNFAVEKVIASLYLIMFVLLAGMGLNARFLSVTPEVASSATIETALK